MPRMVVKGSAAEEPLAHRKMLMKRQTARMMPGYSDPVCQLINSIRHFNNRPNTV